MTDAEIIDWVIGKINSPPCPQLHYYQDRKGSWRKPREPVKKPDASEMGKLRLFLCTHGVDSLKELLKRLAEGRKLDECMSDGDRVEEPINPFGKRYQNKYYAVYKFLKDYLADLPEDEDDAKRALAWLMKLLEVAKKDKKSLELIGGN